MVRRNLPVYSCGASFFFNELHACYTQDVMHVRYSALHTRTHAHTHTYAHKHTHTHIHTHIQTHAHTHTHNTHAHTHAHTHAYTRTHTHTHTHHRCYHALGTPQSDDPVVWHTPDQPEWMTGASMSDDGRWVCSQHER
jgi:protease II